MQHGCTLSLASVRLLLLFACLCWPLVSWAAIEPVKPGEIPALKPNEALILAAVDTNIPLDSVRLNRDGKVWGDGVMSRLQAGHNYRLYVAPAGRYVWRELMPFNGFRYLLKDDEELEFQVDAGTIVYPGDLVFRPTSMWRADVHRSNRSLAAMDWLQRTHPGLYASLSFTYSGHYPDPFPAFYKERAGTAEFPAEVLTPATAHKPGKTKDKEKDKDKPEINPYWRDPEILSTSLNPAGTRLALQVRQDESHWSVDLIDLRSSFQTRLGSSDMPLDSFRWADDDTLLTSVRLSNGLNRISVLHITTSGDTPHYASYLVPGQGKVLDLLPGRPGHILLASMSRDGVLMVHPLNVANQAAVESFRPTVRSRMNTGIENDTWWFVDGTGALSLGIVRRGDDHVLVQRQADGFHDVMTISDELSFDPIAISADASKIYALTDDKRSQRDLVEYSVATRSVTRTIYSQQGIDIHSVIFDDSRNPIGVEFYRDGQLLSEYFHANDARIARQLENAFPGQAVQMIGRSRDGGSLIVQVDGADSPPQLYHLDVKQNKASLVAQTYPWLAERQFAPTNVLKFKASDGLDVEAFLTLPQGQQPRPLVVLPHGGPIGVADSLHFDPEVQFLASRGYAVLRVNFRGSEGYGRAFREAGHRNYGTRIEDDIDTATIQALAKYPLDASRMCVVGSSYGGYSALVSAIRWPERFRCAVSIAGISDRMLFFMASDTARSEKGRQLAEKIMGNPKENGDEMRATSPLYGYAGLSVPVMLAHGREDQRVDFEHSRRIARMLRIAGRPPVELYFDDEGHGVDDPANRTELWNRVADFLDQSTRH